MARMTGAGICRAAVVTLFLSTLAPGTSLGDGVIAVWPGSLALSTANLFPNWVRAPVATFTFGECDDVTCSGCTTSSITGLTLVNIGSAQGGAGGDIGAVYFRITCGKIDSGTLTMTFAGIYQQSTGNFPAWTWAGASPMTADPCAECLCAPTLAAFVDIAACPADGATVQMAMGYNDVLAPLAPGGLTDSCGFDGPDEPASMPMPVPIQSVVKSANLAEAAPGDTITYTVYYGRPGTNPLTDIELMDSLPSYTHYVPGSASIPPDPGWDPDPGPPVRMRWTMPGPFAVAGGATGSLTFQVTVDWGNGEAFEPGSGDVAAPEGYRIGNQVAAAFGGSSCPSKTSVSLESRTVVRRFLMWILGDNDVLFAGAMGQPPDEITYSVFVKNVSTSRTWWKISAWDSVPPDLDTWCSGCGFDDAFAGWTMTPTGGAAASPGRQVSGNTTLLTWRMDMGPGETIELRWKAQVKATATSGARAVNQINVLPLGRTGVVDGTGDAQVPARFGHLATIVLRTTYVSYTGWEGGMDNDSEPLLITFFPLNKSTQFELFALEYEGGEVWPNNGGLSASIGCRIGDCTGGFGGSNASLCPASAIPAASVSTPGCGPSRTPAAYRAGRYGTTQNDPDHWVYKMISNSPLLWQTLTDTQSDSSDNMTYAPSSTLSFRGMSHYMWRLSTTNSPGYGTELSLINTALTIDSIVDPARATTVHLFSFDYTALQWVYRRTYQIDGESQAYDATTYSGDIGPWMVISSDTNLIINQAVNMSERIGCCCTGCVNNGSAYMPTRETGCVASGAGGRTFYGLVQTRGEGTYSVSIDNGGAAPAVVTYSLYTPLASSALPAGVPMMLKGTSGKWTQVGGVTIPNGIGAAANPAIYSLDGPGFTTGGMGLYKVELVSGGPIQVRAGKNVSIQWSGGAVLHAMDPAGSQAGTRFWYAQTNNNWTTGGCSSSNSSIMSLDFFCPASGMAVRLRSEDGYSAAYTTTGADQVVAFMELTDPARKRNYEATVLTPSLGSVIGLVNGCMPREKGYTSPFLSAGAHYTIIAPAVVYVGESFWITVIVATELGGTKTDYCGTTSFTSTDPGAKIEAQAMDSFNFTWTSVLGCSAVPNENGVKVFVNVSMARLGTHTLVAGDSTDGSITGLTTLMVVGVDVKLTKEPRISLAASGDTVKFRICWSNYSSASAFTFVVTDAVPTGMTFVPEAAVSALDCGSTDGVGLGTSYSTTASAAVPGAASFTSGNPVAGTRWLRWTVPMAGVQTTGCACFRATVN